MGKWDRATFPPSSAAEGQRLTEQKSGRQMLLQLSQVFLAYQVHICLFDSHHISLSACISGLFDQLSLKKACGNCSIDTDISCLSYHHLHNLKLSESCSNRHIHHQCHHYFIWKFSIFLDNNLHNCWQPERGVTAQINLHCDHQHWQKYWNCHRHIISIIVSIVLCFIVLVIFTLQHHHHHHHHQHRH